MVEFQMRETVERQEGETASRRQMYFQRRALSPSTAEEGANAGRVLTHTLDRDCDHETRCVEGPYRLQK